MSLTVGSLFSGIGGLDLGLERAGMTVAWQSEVDPYCCRVLNNHWPHVPNLGDVKAIDWAEVPRVELIAGGYPCQPFSLAGRRLGDEDPRHLWPYMLDALRVLRPRWALLENVAGHLAMGFGRVLGDLAEVGYDAEWDCLPAAAVGAPHRRDRVYVVAYPQRQQGRAQPLGLGGSLAAALAGHDGPDGHVADADGGRLEVGPELDRQPSRHAADGGAQGRHAHRRRDEVANPDGPPGGPARHAESREGATPDGVRSLQPGGRGGVRLADAYELGRDGRPRVFGTGRRPQPADSGGWTAEPDVGRVASRLSPGLDGGLDAHPECITEASAAGVPQTERLRTLRDHLAAASASSESARCHLCGHPLSALPCRGACAPWRLGSGGEEAEDLRCLREGVLELLAHAGEDVQSYLSLGAWAAERTQTMGSRVDRLRALGNAVVPQVAEHIGRLILEAA